MDKHNKNEKTIVLRPTVDYRDPKQRDPWYQTPIKHDPLFPWKPDDVLHKKSE